MCRPVQAAYCAKLSKIFRQRSATARYTNGSSKLSATMPIGPTLLRTTASNGYPDIMQIQSRTVSDQRAKCPTDSRTKCPTAICAQASFGWLGGRSSRTRGADTVPGPDWRQILKPFRPYSDRFIFRPRIDHSYRSGSQNKQNAVSSCGSSGLPNRRIHFPSIGSRGSVAVVLHDSASVVSPGCDVVGMVRSTREPK
jgi:hypothetical protein